jgi:hypothetical protein
MKANKVVVSCIVMMSIFILGGVSHACSYGYSPRTIVNPNMEIREALKIISAELFPVVTNNLPEATPDKLLTHYDIQVLKHNTIATSTEHEAKTVLTLLKEREFDWLVRLYKQGIICFVPAKKKIIITDERGDIVRGVVEGLTTEALFIPRKSLVE